MTYLIPGLAIGGMCGIVGICVWQFAVRDILGLSEIFILAESTEYKKDPQENIDEKTSEYFCWVDEFTSENCSIYKFSPEENKHTTIAKNLTKVKDSDKLLWSEMNKTKNKYVILKINLATFNKLSLKYEKIKIKPKWSKNDENYGELNPILAIKDDEIESNIKVQHALIRVMDVSDSSMAVSSVVPQYGGLIVSGGGAMSHHLVWHPSNAAPSVVEGLAAAQNNPPDVQSGEVSDTQGDDSTVSIAAQGQPADPEIALANATDSPQQEASASKLASTSPVVSKAQSIVASQAPVEPATKVTLITGQYKCYFSNNFNVDNAINCKMYKFSGNKTTPSIFDGKLTESTDIEKYHYYLVDFGQEYKISQLLSKDKWFSIKSSDSTNPTIQVSFQSYKLAWLLTVASTEDPKTTSTHIISIPY